jgi:hypothetical protein
MDPIGTAGTGGITAATPLRVFLSHTSDLGKPDEPGSFVAAAVEAVLRARHAVTDMAYFAARDTSPANVCVEMVAQSDVHVGIIRAAVRVAGSRSAGRQEFYKASTILPPGKQGPDAGREECVRCTDVRLPLAP